MTFFYHESFNYFLHGESFDTLVHKHVYLHNNSTMKTTEAAAIRQEIVFLYFIYPTVLFVLLCFDTLEYLSTLSIHLLLMLIMLLLLACARFMLKMREQTQFSRKRN